MKLRIKGNFLRLRLTRIEVEKLVQTGRIEERTSFGANSLAYALQSKPGLQQLTASFEHNTITVFIPAAMVKDWDVNETVGFDARMPAGDGGSLYILVEKDFKCLDETMEDQSDNYENPNKA